MIQTRSKITQAVLNYFLLQDGKELYVNELARRLSLDSGNLTRKLIELEAAGILTSHWMGEQRYYGLNKNFPFLKEYKNIILKTLGFESRLKEALIKIKGIKTASIFGSYAQNKMNAASDIDLLVVGSHSVLDVNRAVAVVQKMLDREINVISMAESEYLSRKKAKDPLISSIEHNKRIVLI